ncbi:MAG TPA: hypothetical protein VNB90_12810 [Cytophagaceae bacterium]|jgi:hypothetical protein|nr:hypothetical protein [Cytophagaceae bacterium]
MGKITQEKVKVYEIIVNMTLKCICTLVSLGILIVVVYQMIRVEPWQSKAVYAAFSAVLTGTVYKVFTHFFPSVRTTVTVEKTENEHS